MKILKILKCIKCLKKSKKSILKLKKKDNIISCSTCKEVYPVYEGIPVILSKEGDFHHLRRALLPAKYRINQKI
jgi:uncharacterized protein YbaR (Trm112 family)